MRSTILRALRTILSRGSFFFLEELRIPIFFRDLLTFTMVAHSILKSTQCIQIHIQQLFNQMYTFWLESHYQDFLGLGFTETRSTIERLFLRYNLFSKLNMYFSFSIPISIRKCKKSPERSTYYSLIFATCTNNTILFCKIHDFPILYFHLSCSGCTV